MQPRPCPHCGVNFMRHIMDIEIDEVCNNCAIRDKSRAIKPSKPMNTIDILVKCPADQQKIIEEYCISNGMDFSKYFMNLHFAGQALVTNGIRPSINEEYIEKTESPTQIETPRPVTPKTKIIKKGKKK